MSNGTPRIVSKESVKQWAKDAQETLNQAQLLCSNAQAKLHDSFQELTIHLPDKLNTIEYLVNSYRKQYSRIKSQVEMINKTVHEKIDLQIGKFQTVLDPSLKNLNDVLSKLKSTNVPSFILEQEVNGEKNLFDFVSINSIDTLTENIEIYKSNSMKLKSLIQEQLKKLIVDQFESFQQSFDESMKMWHSVEPFLDVLKTSKNEEEQESTTSVIHQMLSKNQSLENDLVSILQMLTNHYDQCMKAVELVSFNEENVNLEILANDAEELPQVIQELKDLINENNQEMENFKASLAYKNIDLVKTTIIKEMTKFRSFKVENLPTFILLLDQVLTSLANCSIDEHENDTKKTPIDMYSELLDKLTFHYTQFLSIYRTKYLKELHHQQYMYPRKFLRKISEFLDGEIYRIQLEEINHRNQWMMKYGEFLPKQFRLPGETDLPTVVQVITEGLEHIQFEDGAEREFNQGEEKHLLDLIKSAND